MIVLSTYVPEGDAASRGPEREHRFSVDSRGMAPPVSSFWTLFPRDPGEFRLYVRDVGVWLTVTGVQEELPEDYLPEPPRGFYWRPSRGGPMFWEDRYYRLWSDDLGYMPASE